MVTLGNGMFAYNHESALDLVLNLNLGLSVDEIKELARLLLGTEYTDLVSAADADTVRGDNWELIADGYYNAMVSAINIIDDALEKPRLTKSRETLEQVRNQLENY